MTILASISKLTATYNEVMKNEPMPYDFQSYTEFKSYHKEWLAQVEDLEYQINILVDLS